MAHKSFSITNPNKVRAVWAALSTKPSVLYTPEVLDLLGDTICVVDQNNPNLAASLLKMLQAWRQLPPALAEEAKRVLERALGREGCSKNASEIASTALAE